ncbi:MAG: hypothetical protein AAGI11_06110 [Pseudomonadota bacterium]
MRRRLLMTSPSLFLALAMAVGSAAIAQEAIDVEENQPAEDVAETPEPAVADEAPQPQGSPFEYEASEQISEDLSVSFPVDI